jgi:uncharacterized membrane protein
MNSLGAHLRNKLLAGAVTLVPFAIIVYSLFWLEEHTQPLALLVGMPTIPGLGALVGLVGVYLLGVVATSLIGAMVARLADRLLLRIPGLNLLYRTWKDVLVLPRGKAGVYHRVVLVPSPGDGTQLAFTSGETLPGDPPRWCVFVPSLPNPLSGQLVFLPCARCVPLQMTVEEAFKLLLSTGNYSPPGFPGEVQVSPGADAGCINSR